MIKVIIGYKLKKGADIQTILFKLRSTAMSYLGYVGSENLLSEQDPSIVTIITTWNGVEDWRLWEISRARQELLQELMPLLAEEPKITIYRIMPTTRWQW
jgi:antibiotic biosynthesis monooxygenase (ABM) superfamily enzyme